MNFLVPVALFGWPLISILLFTILEGRKAVIASMLGAWLFLPMASYEFPGIPNYSKMTAASLGVVIGMLLFDIRQVLRIRFAWTDVTILVWCISPFLSSMANGLGPYDGLSAALNHTVTWAVPYLIGRIYFRKIDDLKLLAVGLFLGGLVYIPFCLIEMRMSPQLHIWIYGYYPHSFFGQSVRSGGWRPTVFMQHGLMVGMWMCMTGLIGLVLWKTKAVRNLLSLPFGWLVAAVLATAVLCKSFGAIVLLTVGFLIVWINTIFPSRIWMLVLALAGPAYMTTRISGWTGDNLVQFFQSLDEERADSLAFRMFHENQLIAKALQQPVFGWGGWGRNRIYNEQGEDISITDGQWVIELGVRGLFGLALFSVILLIPIFRMAWKVPATKFLGPQYASLTAIVLVVTLYFVDCIPNAMINPIFMMAAGAAAAIDLTVLSSSNAQSELVYYEEAPL